MIFARDKGRMCNNILQYGHVYAWAREHGRKSVSMRFCYKYQYFRICSTPYHSFLTYLIAKYMAKWGMMLVVGFHDENIDTTEKERLMLSAGNVMVEGWYVRFYDLFLKYKPEIVNLFSFKKSISDGIMSYLASKTGGSELNLGVHIRRGDYKTWKGGRYYFDDDTYIGYIRRFAGQHNDRNINVFICGNDPSLDKTRYMEELGGPVKAHGAQGFCRRISVFFPDGNPGEDLCLLSECDYIMGAPSTFSLVASMYHDRPLMWIECPYTNGAYVEFKDFDNLFRNIR